MDDQQPPMPSTSTTTNAPRWGAPPSAPNQSQQPPRVSRPLRPVPSESPRESTTARTSLSERLAVIDARIAAHRAEEESERAAFTGACFPCRDTGWVREWEGRVPCVECARGAAVRQEQEALHYARERAYALKAGGVPPRRLGDTLDTFPLTDAPALARVRAVLADWDGESGLLLSGPYGTGKTGLLVGALQVLVMRYLERYDLRRKPHLYDTLYSSMLAFMTTTDLMDALRAGYEDGTFTQTLARVKRVRLLALDDLGAEKPTEWVQERLFGIVNHRYEHQLPTFATTNYSLSELAERIGPRVLERLLETCDVVRVEGENLRMR